MFEGLMGQAIERYFKAQGKEPSAERRMDYGRLGLAGETEYQFRFGDAEERIEAQRELLRITEAMRAGGGLEILDQNVVGLMRGIDVKTATPNDVMDRFAKNADTIAGEIKRKMEAGGIKDEDVLEAGPWVVLRAGERAAVKLMAAQGDPRASEFLEASKPLAGASDIKAPPKEYDVPEWVQVVGGVALAEVVDALQEGKAARQPQTSPEVVKEDGLSFALIQQELESLVDNPDPERERELINMRAKVLAEAKRAGVLDSIRGDIQVAQNSANMDFRQAYEAIRDMEGIQYEIQLRGQRILRPEWEGIVDHYRLGVLRNMDMAIIEETASRGGQVDRVRLERLRRERSLLGWGNPPPDVRAMAKKYLDTEIEKRRRAGEEAEARRRADDEARARADAERKAQTEREKQTQLLEGQGQRLRELEARLADARGRGDEDSARRIVEELAGLRQDIAAGRPEQRVEESTYSPEYVVKLARIAVIEAMERGEFKDATEVGNATNGVNVLKAKGLDQEARLLSAEIELAKVLTAYEKRKPETVFERGKIDRQEVLSFLGVPGVMILTRECLRLAGYDVSPSSSIGEQEVERRAARYRNKEIVPKDLATADRDKYVIGKVVGRDLLVGLGDLKDKTVFELKREDEANFRSLMRRIVAGKIGAREDDLRVRETTAIVEAFVWRYLQLANDAVGDGAFPWCKGEGVRVMHPYQEARDWAIKQKAGGVHTKVVQLNLGMFPEKSPAYKPTPAESPGYWLFPGDWLSSTLFNPGLFKKEGGEKTLFGYIVRGEAPPIEAFVPKDVMGGEGFKRGAAVALDKELYPPDETKAPMINIELDLSKQEVAYADDLAKTIYGIASDYGWLNEVVLKDGRVVVPVEIQRRLERLTSVVALARIRMGSDLRTIRLDEYRAKVLSIVLRDLSVEHVVDSVPVKIKIVNDRWLDWLRTSVVGVRQSLLMDPYDDYFHKAIRKPLFAEALRARAYGSPSAGQLSARFLQEGVGIAGAVRGWLGGGSLR